MEVTKTYELLTSKFRSGNADKPGVYFDEENRRHLLSIRQTYALAASNLSDQDRKQEAMTLLNKAESLILTESLPHAMVSRGNFHNQISMIYLEASYKAGNKALANKLKAALKKDLTEQKAYYTYLKNNKEEYYPTFINEEQDCDQYLNILDQWEKLYSGAPAIVTEIPGKAADSTDSTRKK